MDDPLPSWSKQMAAFRKGDEALILAAAHLPGCIARRFDFSNEASTFWGVELCFADGGPIAPIISLRFGKYLGYAGVRLYYYCMLGGAADLPGAFSGGKIPGSIDAQLGAEGIAARLLEIVHGVDLAKLVAAGSIERIFSDPQLYPDSWTSLRLALCGVYLGEFKQAEVLLDDCLAEVTQEYRPNFAAGIAKTKAYRQKLKADPEALRQELIATMNDNWSHFKIVDTNSV